MDVSFGAVGEIFLWAAAIDGVVLHAWEVVDFVR